MNSSIGNSLGSALHLAAALTSKGIGQLIIFQLSRRRVLHGARTTDATEAVHGVILPMAGHKGYAISFMMDVLSGVLTGSATGEEVHGPYEADKRSGCGHLFLAIDIKTLGSAEGLDAKVSALITEAKTLRSPKVRTRSTIPVNSKASPNPPISESGPVLPEQTVADLRRLAVEQAAASLPPAERGAPRPPPLLGELSGEWRK